MNHIQEHVWVDLTRGVISSEPKQEIDTHLALGCSDCKASLELWRSFATFARNEQNYMPPDDLVRLAKLSCVDYLQPEPESGAFAQLRFDSLSNPLPVGVRSAAASARQVVYEAEGLTVDLRFELLKDTSRYFTSGQVLDSLAPNCSMVKATIFLWTARGQLLATTETNDFGEFQFEFEPQDQLRISIETEGRRTLRIPLRDLN